MAYYGLLWLTMAYYGLPRLTTAYYGLPWLTMAYHGLLRLTLATLTKAPDAELKITDFGLSKIVALAPDAMMSARCLIRTRTP